ncbi:division/cell wall cluster transcriptional repressor MraZ [Kordia sp. YSTF-M3]|uniref:Transcriptional regulator MraZ n=1 Tax=Kordia aestuariivivens TaxID=2759037 RepID=A0ABR7Q473_9FLAO|nr:division/cell wall cluster transcriptional repressor MraZ [Kordia aestuariivivens]MBC8753322.1 division/cell wall cluster transcriptional repressor MraZ [Kordia aestuariivivens]
MINLIGTYECKVDAKGRMLVPSAVKKQLSPVLQDGFIIKQGLFGSCLELHPMSEWNTVTQTLNKLSRFDRENVDFIRRFNKGVRIVEIDSAGRLLIPKDLVVFAGIKKEIVLSSAINIIEIWDKEKYEAATDDATVDIGDLAEKVMGNGNGDGNGIS